MALKIKKPRNLLSYGAFSFHEALSGNVYGAWEGTFGAQERTDFLRVFLCFEAVVVIQS